MQQSVNQTASLALDDEPEIGLGELAAILAKRWKILAGVSVAAGAVALGVSFLIPPT